MENANEREHFSVHAPGDPDGSSPASDDSCPFVFIRGFLGMSPAQRTASDRLSRIAAASSTDRARAAAS